MQFSRSVRITLRHRKSTKPIVCNATLDLTFKELKDIVCKAPSLLLPDPSKLCEVETDASNYAIGAILYERW